MPQAIESTALYDKTLGCLLGGLIGDAMGTPTEGKDYRFIQETFGWVDDFSCDGTDDTVMKNLLCEALTRTGGYATLDDWGAVWLDHWGEIFGSKMAKFFMSVLHTAHKMKRYSSPRMAALGNMPSSSSAMCISPVGIVNAGNPRQAALQAYNLAALIHVHDVGFCQDGAASMAAAVAAAFVPGATVESVLSASTAHLLPLSGAEMLGRIDAAVSLAREAGDYVAFREQVYDRADRFFCEITCDSRETVPLTLALFLLAEGDVTKAVTYGANLGRDADTIASMCGAIAGALQGVAGVRHAWIERVNEVSSLNQEDLARRLCEVALAKAKCERQALDVLTALL